tara:strand:+ start:347 stop:1306 length:960 start_codon:yes stop_codon:yes gene_type:complete
MKKLKISDPKKLRTKMKSLDISATNYRNQFINKKSKLYRSEYTEKRNCPACKSNNYLKIFKKEGGIFVKCLNCTMVYLNPVFKDKELIKYYENNVTVQSVACVMGKKFYQSIYGSGLKLIESFSKKGKMLDVGCCSGMFLDVAKKKGWSTYGTEINKIEYKMAAKNHTVWKHDLEKIHFKEKFDAVTFWDVFEHIKHPYKTLKNVDKILNKNGVIFLQVPNSNSLAAKILREKCNMFDPIEHVNLYNTIALEHISKISKFKILKINSVIDEINVIKNYLNYEDAYLGSQNKLRPLNFINIKNIHKNFMGYKLQVILRRK